MRKIYTLLGFPWCIAVNTAAVSRCFGADDGNTIKFGGEGGRLASKARSGNGKFVPAGQRQTLRSGNVGHRHEGSCGMPETNAKGSAWL
ncbi:MAG: hypothetical protein P4L82_05405 [Ancalomicrobiaceae bacterium]|nr:hypothetical protein [Ancalomicrobiaceae bacterium]